MNRRSGVRMAAALAASFVLIVLLVTAIPAYADEYLFGFSGSTGTQDLVITLAEGGPLTFSTSTSPFDTGVDNQGWWSSSDPNSNLNDNYVVGTFFDSGHNNFFTFDLSTLPPTAVAATLMLTRYIGASDTGALTHTYSLFDVSTDAATLNNNTGTSGAIFADLGSGKTYGSFAVSVAGASGDVLSFPLNLAAVLDINAAAGHFFSIGGTLTPAAAVPEPATLLLLGSGLAGLGLWRRRHA